MAGQSHPVPRDPATKDALGKEIEAWWNGLDLGEKLHAHFLFRSKEEDERRAEKPVI